LRLEVGLGIYINLDINGSLSGLNRVYRNARGVEKTSKKLSNTSWAPFSLNLTGLEVELGSKNGVLNAATSNPSEGKRLVDGGALVSKSIDTAIFIDGNADGKTTSNTGGGLSRGGEVLSGDAWNVLNFGLERTGEKLSATAGLELS